MAMLAELPGVANAHLGAQQGFAKNCWGVQRPKNFQAGMMPKDVVELYNMVLQMNQSQLQYFDATCEKIHEAIYRAPMEKGHAGPGDPPAPRAAVPGASQWRPTSPTNAMQQNGTWEETKQNTWQPASGPVKPMVVNGYDKNRPSTADWKSKMTTPRGGPGGPTPQTNSGFPMPSPEKLAANANNCGFPMPPPDKLDTNALAADLQRCEFMRQVSGQSPVSSGGAGRRAVTPVRQQMDTGFGRQVSTQSTSSRRGASQTPNVAVEKTHVGRTQGVSQANQLKLFMK